MVKKPINRIVVLMYHSFDSSDEPSEFTKKGDLVYVVDIEDFKKQMEYLAKGKVPIVTLQDCYTKENFAEGNHTVSVILTFDDGNETNYTKAFPILKQNGFKAYFFITTDWIGQRYYMTEAMIRDLHNNGMMIGSHGKTHKFLPDLTDKELDDEMRVRKPDLRKSSKTKYRAFHFPGAALTTGSFVRPKKWGILLFLDQCLLLIWAYIRVERLEDLQ